MRRLLFAVTVLAPSFLGIVTADETQVGNVEHRVGYILAPAQFDEEELELASWTPQAPFSVTNHRQLTPTEAACSEDINQAIYFQDYLQQQRSAAHFDNCAFDEGLAYINGLIAEVDSSLTTPAGATPFSSFPAIRKKNGLLAIGQILHAIQDFYAHSNYVELRELEMSGAVFRFNTVGAIPTMPIWLARSRGEIADLQTNGLVSGTWPVGLPKRCKTPSISHDELNKDTMASRAGAKTTRWGLSRFQVAYGLAQRASQQFFLFSGERWPVLKTLCGDQLQYLAGGDRRTP